MKTADLLLEFSSKCGVPGVEDATAYAKELLAPYGTVTVSPLGSVLCTVREPEEGQPHVLLDAHIDEIGLIVTRVGEDGFLRVGQIGGTNPRLLAASRVTIHTKNGNLNGVVCSVPPHLSGGQENKALPADKVYIDVGLSGEEAQEQIALGDRISFQGIPAKLLGHHVTGKAFDDRAGCVSLLKALDYLGEDIPCGLTVMFSNMEEIGGQGARTGAFAVNPTHALAVDVSFGDTPDSPSEKTGKMGQGPMIGFSPILHADTSRHLVELAKEAEIPYQAEVMGGGTGTNADSIITSRGGLIGALISIPLRYMHMPVEVVDTRDVDLTGKLIALWIQDLAKGGN